MRKLEILADVLVRHFRTWTIEPTPAPTGRGGRRSPFPVRIAPPGPCLRLGNVLAPERAGRFTSGWKWGKKSVDSQHGCSRASRPRSPQDQQQSVLPLNWLKEQPEGSCATKPDRSFCHRRGVRTSLAIGSTCDTIITWARRRNRLPERETTLVTTGASMISKPRRSDTGLTGGSREPVVSRSAIPVSRPSRCLHTNP